MVHCIALLCPGPSRVSDSSVSAETVIYETFVLIGEKRVVIMCITFLEEKSVEKLDRLKDGLVSNFSILHASDAEKPHPSSPIKTKAS